MILDDVINIEKISFVSPWDMDMFSDMIDNDNYIIELIKIDNKALAYMILFRVFEVMEIIKIAVIPEERRKGYALFLIEKAIKIAKEKECDNILLEVREGNYPALSLYEKKGFKKISTRKNYYSDTNENALIYKLDL